jgi:hypothetical protein
MKLSNRSIGWMLAGGMLALLVTAMLIRAWGDYPSLAVPATSPTAPTTSTPPTQG